MHSLIIHELHAFGKRTNLEKKNEYGIIDTKLNLGYLYTLELNLYTCIWKE